MSKEDDDELKELEGKRDGAAKALAAVKEKFQREQAKKGSTYHPETVNTVKRYGADVDRAQKDLEYAASRANDKKKEIADANAAAQNAQQHVENQNQQKTVNTLTKTQIVATVVVAVGVCIVGAWATLRAVNKSRERVAQPAQVVNSGTKLP